MSALAARIQRWALDLSLRRIERYGPILSPRRLELLERDVRALGVGDVCVLLAEALHVRPLHFLRTGPVRDLLARLRDQDTPTRRVLIRQLQSALTSRVTNATRVIDDASLRRHYERDLGGVPPFLAKLFYRTLPHLVVQPGSTEDLLATLAVAREQRQAVYPRGVASWGFGGAVPTLNGILIDLSPLDEICEPDVAGRTIVVAGGAKWGQIADRLERSDLELICYPSSRYSTVGGWIATGGYGLTAYGSGHLSHSVDWVELVTMSGRVIRVTHDDENFALLFGSEGQLGVIARVQLRVRRRAAATFPHLIHSARRDDLFAFVRALGRSGLEICMVKYLDRELMVCFNDLFRERMQEAGGSIVEEEHALLVQVDGPDHEAAFGRFLADYVREQGDPARFHEAPAHVARYVWHDRFNPLKIQILGPSLLAGELLIGAGRAGDYIDAVKALGRQFKLDVFIEAHFLRPAGGGEPAAGGEPELLLIPMFHSDRRRPWLYLNHLTLVPALTHLGVRMGGRPYGIGIWNTPYLRVRHDADHLTRLARWKSALDPEWAVNPRKFWSIRSRFLGLPGLMFAPRVYARLMDLLVATGRLRGRLVPRRPSLALPIGRPTPFLHDVELKCTNCGNCVAVCPAYQVTRDERTTARVKLRLGPLVVDGRPITQSEADASWLCTRCGECERVCQAKLPLLRAYDALEAELEPRCGRPEESIRAFVEGLGENPDYLELIDSRPYRAA